MNTNPLDNFLSNYDVFTRYERRVKSSALNAYEAFKKVDFNESFLIRALLRLRGIYTESKIPFVERIFTPLFERPPAEIGWGLIARPWNFKEKPHKVTSEQFRNFTLPGYAKIVWGFTFYEQGEYTLLGTETRIKCTDRTSLLKFRIYWFFVAPFSGLIRKKILSLIEKNIQKSTEIKRRL